MAINKELFKGCSKTIVLQLLEKEKMHGYELSARLKELSSGELEITEGTLYPLLHSLESDKYIKANWETSGGGRKKKVYELTSSGKKALKVKRQEWQHFVSTMKILLPAKREINYVYSS